MGGRKRAAELKLGLSMGILSLALLAGCTTVERPQGSQATTSNEIHPTDQYPMWTRVTGWLLTPFTGASGSVGF